jgi:hypothetical protein
MNRQTSGKAGIAEGNKRFEVMEMRIPSKEPAKVFRNTVVLLENYRNLIWSLEESLDDVEKTVHYMGGRHLSNLFHLLSLEIDEYNNERSRTAVEERLSSLQESRVIVDCMDKAMLKLKTYPENGERYFQILHAAYIDKKPLHQDEIQDRLLISSSTFYRYKKKAIEILGGILWGFLKLHLPLQNETIMADKGEIYEKKMNGN